MTSNASTPASADIQVPASFSLMSLAETGEVEIAGRRYVTDRRLAKLLNITPRTLARWNASRIGPRKISVGKTILYDVEKLPDWLASRETAAIHDKRR